MKIRVICLPIALGVAALFSTIQAFAWQKDPDAVDPSQVTSIITQLLAPNPTIGDTDTTLVGIGTDPIGSGDLTAMPSDPPSASTIFVNNMPGDESCPTTPYTTIQQGIDASGPGDTVKVCPGTYVEQDVIGGHTHDGLKLESVVPQQAVIQWPAINTPPTNHQLVDVTNANGVVIRGFTMTGPFNSLGCQVDRFEGVLFDNAFTGEVDHSHITLIRDSNPALWGCQQGDAVAIGHRNFGTPGSATVDHNLIDKYQKNGVQAVNSGTSARIEHNTIIASTDAALQTIIASNGVVVFMQASATIDHNSVSENQYTPGHFSTGIILDEAPSGSSEIDHNSVFNNDYGIEADSETNLDISHNDVMNNTNDALLLCGDVTFGCTALTDLVVRANDIENNGGSGIFLNGANENLLKSNHIENNGAAAFGDMDGIHADKNSSGNEILTNQLGGNVSYDCADDSSGTGTAGTANTWQNDHGLTSSPPGLCS